MAKYQGDFFAVNNVARPVPAEMSVTVQKLSNSDAGRDQSGNMHVNYIRRVRTISFSWNQLTPAEVSELMTAFDGSDYFSVTYQDPALGRTTKTFYSGDITTKMYSWTTKYKRYESFTVNLIER